MVVRGGWCWLVWLVGWLVVVLFGWLLVLDKVLSEASCEDPDHRVQEARVQSRSVGFL